MVREGANLLGEEQGNGKSKSLPTALLSLIVKGIADVQMTPCLDKQIFHEFLDVLYDAIERDERYFRCNSVEVPVRLNYHATNDATIHW